MRRLAVLDPPSNLGLRPPAPGLVPGCYTAIVTGRGQPDIADMDGLAPYVREEDLVYDPDLDPDGRRAEALANTLVSALQMVAQSLDTGG